jgi:heme/copper-type cytochrome/quinol oxidase subunit 2
MGASPLYRIAAGAAEVAAGFLLMFRRTATVGALAAAAVMANVALLNFSYDVPVKLYSAHLCPAAVFLLIPDFHALFRFLIERREAALSKPWLPEFENPTLRRATKIVHATVILFALLTYGVGVYESTPHHPPYKSNQFPLTTHRFHWISPVPTITSSNQSVRNTSVKRA